MKNKFAIIFGPDWRRLWLHVPGGLLNGLLLIFTPWLGVGFLVGFLVYEVWQCVRISNEAHRDILGHIVGLGIIGGIWLILILIRMLTS